MIYDRYRDELETPITVLAASRFGGNEALRTSSDVWTFDQLRHRVDNAGMRLRRKGVEAGERVALLADGSPESIVLFLALVEQGAMALPLPLRYPEKLLEVMSEEAGASTLIRMVTDGSESYSKTPHQSRVLFADALTAGWSASETPTRGDELGAIEHLNPHSPVLGIHTSGSSGPPKVAALTRANLVFSALGANRVIELGRDDRWLLSLPLYHVGGVGILVRCLLAGACVAIADEPRELARSIVNLGVTHLSLVPTQLRRLLSDPDRDTAIRGLKSVLVGGAATTDDLVGEALDAGLPLHLTYGLTEMSSQVATVRPSGSGSSSVSVLPFRSVRLVDGEILVRGEPLFVGYLTKESVESAVDDEGWFHTGDQGNFDRDGRLVVTGRIDDMFISGGENIHPGVIEHAANKIDEIERSIVVSVHDQEYGARPVLFVRYADAPLAEEDVIAELRSALPSFMLPVAVFELPHHEEHPLDKVNRPKLQGIAYKMLQERRLSPRAANR